MNAEHEVSCLLLVNSASGYQYDLGKARLIIHPCEGSIVFAYRRHLLLYATDLYETACLVQATTWMNNTSLAVKR